VTKLNIVIAYDVDTETTDGMKRLRNVANVCKRYGQRVQYSVFECRLTAAQLEEIEARLNDVIDTDRDSLRIYILHQGREASVRVYGVDRYIDFDDPLVV